MVWISLCLLGIFLSGSRMQPLLDDIDDTEAISDFFVDLFVDDARGGRNLENNEIEQDEMDSKIIESENTKSNPDEVASYNIYMDDIFRRMNAALRAKLMDPMELNLNRKEKKEKKVKNDDKTAVERDVSETDEEEEAEEKDFEVDRMGKAQKKKVKKEKKNDKSKAKKGLSKDKKSGDKKNKNKKGGKKEKDPKVKAQKKAEREKKRQQKREKNKREKEARKTGRLSRDKRNKQSKEEQENKNKDIGTKVKTTTNRGSNAKKDEGKSIGSLSGIATLRRSGDVTVEEKETDRMITSLFTVGPLQLEVSKSYGQGKARTVKTAKAATDIMEGVMVIKVKSDGSAHVKKVVFKKPKHVNVQGSISDQKARSKKILLNSLNKSRPLAAQKILQTARFVLKSPSKPKSN